jgi:glutamyl-tRNA reductase
VVLGEREIITQVREAYEFAAKNGLSGDYIRIAIRHCIETAKKIYTQSDIAKNPVSVVSLACKQLLGLLTDREARIVVVGAGTTNTTLCQLLIDEGFRNFTIFNRDINNAELLAERTGGSAFQLKNLSEHSGGFDVLLTCTAASDQIITAQLFKQLLNGETNKKIIVDLAVPADVGVDVLKKFSPHYINVASVKETSEKNLATRKKELIAIRQLIYEALEDFKQIFKLRQVEIQMRELPVKVGAIRTKAVEQVFAKDISRMDPEARATLEKVLNYMEKKYVSVPMLVAKQLVEQNNPVE